MHSLYSIEMGEARTSPVLPVNGDMLPVTPSDLILKLIYSIINVIPFFLLTGKRFYFFLRDLIMLMLIEVSSINRTRKKIANGLAKLNYNVISLDLFVKEVASRGDIHSACSVSSHDSVRIMIAIIVAATTISLLSVSPGYVSMALTTPGLTSYSTPLNAISPYSVEQGNQLYQTPLLKLGTGLETLSEQEPSETASISSVSSSAPSSSPTSTYWYNLLFFTTDNNKPGHHNFLVNWNSFNTNTVFRTNRRDTSAYATADYISIFSLCSATDCRLFISSLQHHRFPRPFSSYQHSR